MSLTLTTPMPQINAYIEQWLQRLQAAMLRELHIIGEKCLNAARQTNSYRDQTGNLRSSIGYVIVSDGKIVYESSFEAVKNGKDGSSSGAAYAKKLARQFPQGLVLIVVAGMDYAAHVAAKGYDVVDSAELLADRLVPQMLKRLGLKVTTQEK